MRVTTVTLNRRTINPFHHFSDLHAFQPTCSCTDRREHWGDHATDCNYKINASRQSIRDIQRNSALDRQAEDAIRNHRYSATAIHYILDRHTDHYGELSDAIEYLVRIAMTHDPSLKQRILIAP